VTKVLEGLDIKAVQFETLGFLYLRNLVSVGVREVDEEIIVRMVRSYQESANESMEFTYKALCFTSFDECEENLCYGEHIERSYNYLLMLYALYLKNTGKQNAVFYLQ
jgi:hypothetical protein